MYVIRKWYTMFIQSLNWMVNVWTGWTIQKLDSNTYEWRFSSSTIPQDFQFWQLFNPRGIGTDTVRLQHHVCRSLRSAKIHSRHSGDSESFKCPPEAIQTKNDSLSMFLVAQHWRPSSGSFNRQSKSFTSSTQLPWPLGQYDPATPPHKRCESSLLLRKTIGQPRVKQVWHPPFSCFAQS